MFQAGLRSTLFEGHLFLFQALTLYEVLRQEQSSFLWTTRFYGIPIKMCRPERNAV
jgi:hypothetical protein